LWGLRVCGRIDRFCEKKRGWGENKLGIEDREEGLSEGDSFFDTFDVIFVESFEVIEMFDEGIEGLEFLLFRLGGREGLMSGCDIG
jgi:hypothetical protein